MKNKNILSEINQEISTLLYNLFKNQIKNDQDKNNLKKMYQTLENKFKLVDTTTNDINDVIPSGSFIFYIKYNFANIDKIKFNKSGFVTYDDNDIIKIFNYNQHWKIKKKNYIIFRKLKNNELLRLQFSQMCKK